MGELLVNEAREIEYSKDRLNQQIRELQRENSVLKDALFNQDIERRKMEAQLTNLESDNKFISIWLGVMLLVMIVGTLAVIRVLNGGAVS